MHLQPQAKCRSTADISGLLIFTDTFAGTKRQSPTPKRYRPRPALRGGVSRAGDALRPPLFILHCFRPLGSPSLKAKVRGHQRRTVTAHFRNGPHKAPTNRREGRQGYGCHPAPEKGTPGRTGGNGGGMRSTSQKEPCCRTASHGASAIGLLSSVCRP